MEKGEFYIDPDSWFIYKCSKIFDEGVVLYKVNPNSNGRERTVKAYDIEDELVRRLERVTSDHLRESMGYQDRSIAWHENEISKVKHVQAIYKDVLERRGD